MSSSSMIWDELQIGPTEIVMKQVGIQNWMKQFHSYVGWKVTLGKIDGVYYVIDVHVQDLWWYHTLSAL